MRARLTIFLFVLLSGMLGFNQPGLAIQVMPGSDWIRTNYTDDIVQHLPGKPHRLDEVSYPIVLYIYLGGSYAAQKLRYSYVSEYPDGISIPTYIGYMVIDEDFKFKFVDKSNGYAPSLAKWTDALNAMPADHLYYFEGDTFWVPRWSWNGVQAIINKLFTRYSAMAVHGTHGIEPMDDFVPQYEEEAREVVTKDSDKSLYGSEGLHPGRVNYPENVKIHRYIELVPRHE